MFLYFYPSSVGLISLVDLWESGIYDWSFLWFMPYYILFHFLNKYFFHLGPSKVSSEVLNFCTIGEDDEKKFKSKRTDSAIFSD